MCAKNVILCRIRPYEDKDRFPVQELITSATMSAVSSFYLAAVSRDMFWMSLVILIALLFVFAHVPLSACLMLIPLLLIFLYALIWMLHRVKAASFTDLDTIPTHYMKSRVSGFYVAEMFNSASVESLTAHRSREVTFVTEEDLALMTEVEGQRCGLGVPTTVACIALSATRYRPDYAWVSRFVVHHNWRHLNIGRHLLERVEGHARDVGYTHIQMKVNVCNEVAKLFLYSLDYNIVELVDRSVVFGYHMSSYLFCKRF